MPQKIIIDHDGAVDDLIALSVILASPLYDVKAVTVCPADSYRDGAVESTLRFLSYFGHRGVKVAASDEEGVYPFPDEWRRKSQILAKIPSLRPADLDHNQLMDIDAPALITQLLSEAEDQEYVMLMTGPLTHLALALDKDPSIKSKIKRIYIMGGAVNVSGNVDPHPNHDGSAEWNFYNHPPATHQVIHSGIPITLVPLDACNSVPVTTEFLDSIRNYPVLSQSWEISRDEVEKGIYYFWDTLTAAAMIDPAVITTQKMRIKAICSEPQEGRVHVDPDGVEIDVATDANDVLFKSILLQSFRRDVLLEASIVIQGQTYIDMKIVSQDFSQFLMEFCAVHHDFDPDIKINEVMSKTPLGDFKFKVSRDAKEIETFRFLHPDGIEIIQHPHLISFLEKRILPYVYNIHAAHLFEREKETPEFHPEMWRAYKLAVQPEKWIQPIMESLKHMEEMGKQATQLLAQVNDPEDKYSMSDLYTLQQCLGLFIDQIDEDDDDLPYVIVRQQIRKMINKDLGLPQAT